MESKLIPLLTRELPPGRIDLDKNSKKVDEVDLRQVPLGTEVLFRGAHPDSIYLLRVVGPEKNRRVKIWFKGRVPPAIGPIEVIKSIHFEPGEGFTGTRKGIMKINEHYEIPNFYFRPSPKNPEEDYLWLTEGGQNRIEYYTEILIKTP